MQGIILLLVSFLATYVISKYTPLKPLVNMNDKFEYIPIVTAIIVADLLIKATSEEFEDDDYVIEFDHIKKLT